LTITGGTAGVYTIRVRRDISLWTDEDIQEISFNYNGVSKVISISFVPPYATNESSTNGYFIYLIYNGNTLWTMDNSYPPRLLVTK
jgi:hypothetical protein